MRILTQPLTGPPLGLAAARGDVPAAWYPRRSTTAAEWAERVSAIRREFEAIPWLDALAPALAVRGAAAARLERVRAAGGVVVTTGQQPGLFGGPLYTWYKALSALALADAIEAATGVACAPVFWAATDDSDFAEASWTTVALRGGGATLQLPPLPPEHVGKPMAHTPLIGVDAALDALEAACGSAAFPWALDAVRDAYAPGADRSVGGAYLSLLRAMFEPLGIAVLDASDPSTKRAGEPVLRAALRSAADVATALHERATEIAAAGFAQQVADVPSLTLVFREDDGSRRRVRTRDVDDVAALPADVLGANVLLRPVMERAILPTVAYVAGPAELAYFAQSNAVAGALGFAPPYGVPRWSGIILESHVESILNRFGVTIDDLRDPHAAEGRYARDAMPQAVRDALAAASRAVTDAAAHLRAASASERPALAPPTIVDGAERAMKHRLERLERRFLAAVKRRHEQALEDLAAARASLFPVGKLQERALNAIPLFSRHGSTVVDGIVDAARLHASTLVQRSADAAERPARGAPAPDAVATQAP